MEIHADFWPGQRLSKKLCGRRGLYVSFSTVGLHPGSWTNRLSVSRKKFHVTIYVEKARVYGVIWRCFARVKCGSIMSGFWTCYDCRQSHLFLWFTEGVDRYVVELVLPENFVPSLKRFVSVQCRWFCLRKPILCSKIVDFKSSVFGRDLAMGLMVWLT